MPSRFVIGFMTFIFFTGSIIGIYAATQAQPTIYDPQANVNSAQLDAQRHNQAINQTQASQQASNSAIATQLTNSTSGAVTSPTCTAPPGDYLGQIYCDLVNVNNAITVNSCNLMQSLHFPSILTIGTCGTQPGSLNPNNPLTNVAQQQVGNVLGASVSSSSSSNIWLDITGNPVSDALIITGIFLGLGLLAGLFGAGILANVIARVGITLSILYYFNAEMSIFGSVTDFFFVLLILAPLNVLIGIGSLAFILEAMGGGKES